MPQRREMSEHEKVSIQPEKKLLRKHQINSKKRWKKIFLFIAICEEKANVCRRDQTLETIGD